MPLVQFVNALFLFNFLFKVSLLHYLFCHWLCKGVRTAG